MKKVLTLVVATMLIFAAVAAHAAEADWRFSVKTSDDQGNFPSAVSHIGVKTNSSDGVDTIATTQDQEAAYSVDVTNATNWTVSTIAGDTRTWSRNIQAPGDTHTWSLRVAAGSAATNTTMRMQFFTLGTTTMLPSTVGGKTVYYKLKMVDNRNKVGAPANNTVWDITIPTAHSATVPFFSLGSLPVIKLASYSHQNMIDNGYIFELTQGPGGVTPPVPEPSSLLALGTGLSGLAGFVIRRRRA